MTATDLFGAALPSFGDTGDRDPYPYYEALRRKGPVVWDESARAWLVTGYEACRRVEIDEHEFRHPYADAGQTLVDIKGGRRNITILQGDEHARMHLFLMQLFSPKLMAGYRTTHIRPVIDLLFDRITAKGQVDLVEALAAQLPPRVLMSMFAMDWRDDALAARVLDLHELVMNWIGQQNRGEAATAKARAAANEINEVLAPYLAMRKSSPGDDLISRVWLEGPATLAEFTDADALATTREMFLAGTDTTVHALSNALHILLTQPEVMARVSSERGRSLEAFVEEALRLYGSVQYRFRIANADCELEGVGVCKDDVLILINAAANRDPAHYGCPAGVDLDRRNARDHLAFNVGPRTCVGAALARAEMVDALNTLFDRTRNLRLDPDAEPPSLRFHYTRSFRPLNVLFDPA
jgi:cytochrome P450